MPGTQLARTSALRAKTERVDADVSLADPGSGARMPRRGKAPPDRTRSSQLYLDGAMHVREHQLRFRQFHHAYRRMPPPAGRRSERRGARSGRPYGKAEETGTPYPNRPVSFSGLVLSGAGPGAHFTISMTSPARSEAWRCRRTALEVRGAGLGVPTDAVVVQVELPEPTWIRRVWATTLWGRRAR
jgi:hypothetical protein